MIIEGVLGICGVCVNEIFSGGNYGRIQEGYYQFYEKSAQRFARKNRLTGRKKVQTATPLMKMNISGCICEQRD